MRRLLLPLLVVPALLLGAGPASADDVYEIDGRLQDAGFEEAYTTPLDAVDGDGYRVAVDFASASEDRAEYEQEARAIAEVLWEHLEGRLLAVDVAPTSDVPWTPDGLPPAVSFVRGDLQQAFGSRPAGLDDGDVHGEEDLALGGGPDVFGLGLLAVVAVVLLLVVAVVVLVVALAVRRPTRQPEPWHGWQGGGWGPGPGAAGDQVPPPAGGHGDAVAPVQDPWATPPR